VREKNGTDLFTSVNHDMCDCKIFLCQGVYSTFILQCDKISNIN